MSVSPFFSPMLWKTKLLSVWKKLGPVCVHIFFILHVLQTGTQPWPRRILEKGGKDGSNPTHAWSQTSPSQHAKQIKCSWHVQNAFMKKHNNSMSCLSCLKGSRSVFFLSTPLTGCIWGWLVSFSPLSSETSMIVVLSTPTWHWQFLLFQSQTIHCIWERNFHLGLTGKNLDFVDVVVCLLLLRCN